MLNRDEFVRISTDINLFFQRIMMEHLFLIEANLTPVEEENIKEARELKEAFAKILEQTINNALAVSEETLESGEIVTPYTQRAEDVTSKLTGVAAVPEITKRELDLVSRPNLSNAQKEKLEKVMVDINAETLKVLNATINFKTKLIKLSSECKIFISMYHEMLEHLRHEAFYYREILEALQNRRRPEQAICEEFNFWNHIMSEHAQFIDGMLDPTERALKQNAETFANTFERLVERCIRVGERQILQGSLTSTNQFKEFKEAATEGILQCKIKSIIPPILADHVLREANHYLKILRSMSTFRYI